MFDGQGEPQPQLSDLNGGRLDVDTKQVALNDAAFKDVAKLAVQRGGFVQRNMMGGRLSGVEKPDSVFSDRGRATDQTATEVHKPMQNPNRVRARSDGRINHGQSIKHRV